MKKVFILSIIIYALSGCQKQSLHELALQPLDDNSSGSAYRGTTTSILQWQQCFGSSANDLGYSVTKALDGSGYFLTGYTNATANINDGNVTGSHGVRDAWVVKTDLTGGLLWQKAIGGSGTDEANAIVGTPDGGCLITGRTNSNDGDISGNHGGDDVLVAKLSASGAIEWAKALGGTGYDNANALIQTNDGEYALTGSTTSTDGDVQNSNVVNGNAKLWLVKFNISTGTTLISWQKTIGFPETKNENGYSLVQAEGGGYTIAGITYTINNPDIWIINTDNLGNVNWEKKIVSAGGDVAYGVTSSTDINGNITGYIVTGYLSNDLIVVKLKLDGTNDWQKIFSSGAVSTRILGRSVISTSQGIIITGLTDSKNGSIIATKGGEDMFVLRLENATGSKISSNVMGGKGSDIGRSVINTADGGFIAVGSTSSNNADVSGNHGLNDFWAVMFRY